MPLKKTIRFLFISTFLCIPFLASGQKLWLRADQGVTTSNNGGVTEWLSQTNGYEGTQTNTNAQPLLLDGGINFNPIIEFDGIDDYLPLTILETAESIDQCYVLAVIRTDYSGSRTENWAILDFDRSNFFSFSVYDNIYFALNNPQNGIQDITGNIAVNDSAPHIVIATYDNTVVDDVNLYVDGAVDITSDAYPGGARLGTVSNRFALVGDGSEAINFDSGQNGFFYDGEIAEIIYYKNFIPGINRDSQWHSYLAIKYGITLDQSYNYLFTGNIIAWDQSQNYASKFRYNIAGIFRDDGYSLDQRVSKSTNTDAMLTIALDNDFTSPNLDHTSRTTSFTTDLTGLIWGHNGVSKNLYATCLIDNNIITHKKRIWYAADTNFDTNVHLMFSDESIVNGTSYYLISESDGDGNFSNDGVVSSGVVATNNSVTFNNVNVSDKYFTIADKIPNKYMRHGKFFRDGIEQQMKTSE
jgi:hypothetical protein